MRDLGVTPQPMAAFILNLGLETLALRIAKHSANALIIAKRLESEPHVAWVNYPGLASSDQHERAKKYLPNGQSGVISFGVKGGRAAAMKFLDSLKLAAIVVHVADARTSALHPASTTHRQLDDGQLAACGIGPELVRFSVGIENPEDIWDDLVQALKKTEGATGNAD
ncbi:L-methionine gamma-lyase [bioreactor metagenome]